MSARAVGSGLPPATHGQRPAARPRLPLWVLLPFVAMLLSCHKSSTPATTITMILAPTTAELNVNQQTEFFVSVSGGANNTVTWDVNGSVCNPSTGVSAPGGILDCSAPAVLGQGQNLVSRVTYTAPMTVPAGGKATVTATSTDNTSIKMSATVTIDAAAVVTVTPPSVSLAAGGTQQFTVTVIPAPSHNVQWEVNGLPGGFATVGLISNTGLYTAPPSPPPGGSVTITAVSEADPTQFGNATVTLSFGPTSFQGSYAFTMKGQNSSGAFVRSGSFTTDNMGGLASGLEDITTASGTTPARAFVGSYTMGADGRGTLTFNDGLSPSKFRIVMASHNRAQIISFDNTGTASGVAQLQSISSFKTSALIGTYIFDFSGLDSSGNPISEVGEFLMDSMGGIHSGEEDVNDHGAISSQVAFAGTYSVTANGRGTAQFITGSGTFNYIFYVVSNGQLNFVSVDNSPDPVVTGIVTQQQPSATFTQTSLNGSYAFEIAGANSTGKIATVGSFSTVGNGILTGGILDENNAGTLAPNEAFTGSYAVDSLGRVTATLSASNRTYTLVGYLDGNGNADLQETDSSVVSDGLLSQQTALGNITSALVGSSAGSGFSIGDQLSVVGGGGSGAVLQVSNVSAGTIAAFTIVSAGHGYTTTANAALSILTGSGSGSPTVNIAATSLAGNYALQLDGTSGAATQEFVGRLVINSSGTVGSDPSGTSMLDFSLFPSGSNGTSEPLSGTLSIPSGARGTLSLNPSTDNRNFVVYTVNATEIFVLETDSGTFSEGLLLKQF